MPDDTRALNEKALVAQMEQTFYIMGGNDAEYSSDVVYKFDQDNYEWVRQSFVLSAPIEAGVAIPVPDNVVDCL